MQIVMGILCVVVIICLAIVLVDSNRFVVRKYEIETDLIEKDVTFAFLSDLHNKSFGKKNAKLLEAIDLAHPAFICCGGDMPTAHPGVSLDTAIHFMQAIAGKYKIFYANGNHEYRLRIYPEKYGDMHEKYEAALQKMGIHRLLNQAEIWDDNIVIHGLELERNYYKRFHKEIPEVSVLKEQIGDWTKKDGRFHILLAHNPEYFEQYAKTGVHLVLSGHVHGGVARIPFLGGVISPSFRLFPKYDGGRFEASGEQGEDTTMILSRGLGMHTIPLRFLNPAELVLITLKKS